MRAQGWQLSIVLHTYTHLLGEINEELLQGTDIDAEGSKATVLHCQKAKCFIPHSHSALIGPRLQSLLSCSLLVMHGPLA